MSTMSTRLTDTFTFRHVIHACGIPSTNETNWAVGQMLVRIAARKGIEPERILSVKTDPNPSVNAPHCIAHYPIALFEEMKAEISEWWGDRLRQLDMFDQTWEPKKNG